jgi:eukaryotic-like serine/threonine-protein kinase
MAHPCTGTVCEREHGARASRPDDDRPIEIDLAHVHRVSPCAKVREPRIMSEDMITPDETATQVAGVEHAPPKYLERGTAVGRYVVLDRLGEGGMGIVYRAFDPELDRAVALKLLHTHRKTGSSVGDPTWLLREAQALARLSHPNVVIVHDVGVIGDDQVFVAMELVDGVTLRNWLGAERRTWREVRTAMLAAGAGLAAAHAAGLVHRDFKPENVVVGADGRVRVMDFGLARVRSDAEQRATSEPAARGSDAALAAKRSNELTIVEGVIGTPAYMAPELFEGAPADASSDQFSFGVVLWEALSGARPFAKVELLPTRDTPKPVMHANVPARVVAVAQRAIAVDPAARYSAMTALLAELDVDPDARRRRVALGAAAVAVLGLAVGATTLLSRSHAPAACQGVGSRLNGVWDPAIKTRIRAAYASTKLKFADKAYSAMAPALDSYASEWTLMATESCKATRERRDQTEEVMSLRQECLDQRLAELGALTKLLLDPNRGVVEKADTVAYELDPIGPCGNVAMLRVPTAPPPGADAKLADVKQKLIDAKAQLIAGRYLPALMSAGAASTAAKAIGYDGAVAEAERTRGAALMATASNDEAVKTLTGAIWLAETAKRDDLVARDALSLATITAEVLAKPGEARIWLELGEAAAKRSGLDYELDIAKVEGLVAADAGDLPAAVAALEHAWELAPRHYGDASRPVIAGDEALLAGGLVKAFEYAKAIPHFEHAIALRSQVVGMDHPDIALMLSNLAVAYQHTGDPKARPTFERALALREKLFGKASPILVPTLDNYAVYLELVGDLPNALATIERAETLAAQFPGEDNYSFHIVVTDHAEILRALSKLDDARAAYDRALALEAKTQSTALPTTQASRAELALIEKQWAQAAELAALSVTGFERTGGVDNPELWRPLAALGRALAEQGKPDDARVALDRAIKIGERIHLQQELAPARAARAKL